MYKMMHICRYKEANVFSEREQELLNSIDAAISRRYRLNKVHMQHDETDSNVQFKEKVSVMERNLKEVMERMYERNLSDELFFESYNTWKENRKICIKKLEKIAKLLHRDRRTANIIKLCGLCLSIGGNIGLVATGATSASPNNPLPLDPKIALIVSCVASSTGTAIVLGTSITESVRLIRNIKKAKRLIEKDQALFKDIQEGLNHAEELHEALYSVLDIDVLKDLRTEVKKIVQKAIKIKNEIKRLKLIEKKVNAIISNFADDTQVPLTAIVMVPRIIITVILLLCKTENRLAFDFASVSLKSAAVVGLLVGNSLEAVVSTLPQGLNLAQVLNLATGLVGITLDSVAIVKTCMDIHRKSRSPEAEKILTAATKYTKEVENLDKLYESLSVLKKGAAATNIYERVEIRDNPFEDLSQPEEEVSNQFQTLPEVNLNAFSPFQPSQLTAATNYTEQVQPRNNPFEDLSQPKGEVSNQLQTLPEVNLDAFIPFQPSQLTAATNYTEQVQAHNNPFEDLSQPKENVSYRFQSASQLRRAILNRSQLQRRFFLSSLIKKTASDGNRFQH